VAGVIFYCGAGPTIKTQAPGWGRADAGWLEEMAERIRQLGLAVRVSP